MSIMYVKLVAHCVTCNKRLGVGKSWSLVETMGKSHMLYNKGHKIIVGYYL